MEFNLTLLDSVSLESVTGICQNLDYTNLLQFYFIDILQISLMETTVVSLLVVAGQVVCCTEAPQSY